MFLRSSDLLWSSASGSFASSPHIQPLITDDSSPGLYVTVAADGRLTFQVHQAAGTADKDDSWLRFRQMAERARRRALDSPDRPDDAADVDEQLDVTRSLQEAQERSIATS